MAEPNGRTFVLTGGAGFIGSHLAEEILRAGGRVLAVDDLSTGSIDNIAPFRDHPEFQFARASIMDRVVMERMASEADVVVHLAAAVGVKLIVEHPVRTIETNVLGTEEVLRAAQRYDCRVLLASTSEVYGNGSRFPFAEEDDVLLGATSRSRWAYAASKMVDEFLGLAYHREYGLDVVPFRLFNTVGPRQTGQYGMVVPTFVRQALTRQPITVYGDGTQRRCFCDVRDVVKALIGLSGHPEAPGRVYNIGGTEEITIRALAERIKELTGSDSPITTIPYSEAYAPGFEDMERRVPSIDRVNTLLGWEPERSLDEILRDVIEYERGALAGTGHTA
jgi:UDP-glucose 4-epimerase